jgi:hypothetical protein
MYATHDGRGKTIDLTDVHSRELLVRSLDDVRTNATALPQLHILLYLLLQATYPSIASLATFFASFGEHPHVQYLQEAIIDVVTSVEEQETVRKEEAARLSSEIGNQIETNASTEGGLSRSLELLRALIVRLYIQLDVRLLVHADHNLHRLPNG